jgi:hypothetical protein
MASDELFGELPEQARPQTDAARQAAPRLREPQRDQVELRAVDIDSLIGEDHNARIVWRYVEGLDLSELEDRGSRREAIGPVTRRRRRGFCWRFGFTRRVMASAAPAAWRGYARAMMPIAGCVVAYR